MFRICVIAAAVALCAAPAPAVVVDLTSIIRPVPVDDPFPTLIDISIPDLKPFPCQLAVREGGCIRNDWPGMEDLKEKIRWSSQRITRA